MISPPLAVLRRPRGEHDVLPPAVLDELWRRPAAFGVDLALSRTVLADDGRELHVVAGTTCVGLFERTGCGELWTAEQLRAGRAVAGRVEGPGRLRVLGLVADDVTDVHVRLRDGARVRLTIRGGVYDVVLDCWAEGDLPERVLVRSGDAEREVPLGCAGDELVGAPR